ncbi:PH domain-containing protein [Nocardia farcinica]|uniref:PH domain-containing protein n=1 Tax=Nocardia farcinica TaxID=37329 RepID=UPI0024572D59|nr:PH domain-containing protein [Nocardia farcinica]
MSSPHQSVPPGKSSHTAATGSSTGSSSGAVAERAVIRITPLAYLGVVVLALCVFLFFVGWPAGLWWLLLIPVAVAVWVARTRTVVTGDGLELRTVLGSRRLDWAQIKGVSIPKRGFARAHLADDSTVALPAVSYDQLRKLIAASRGRLPDVFGAAAQAERASEDAEAASATDDAPGTDSPRTGTGSGDGGSEDTGGGDTGGDDTGKSDTGKV